MSGSGSGDRDSSVNQLHHARGSLDVSSGSEIDMGNNSEITIDSAERIPRRISMGHSSTLRIGCQGNGQNHQNEDPNQGQNPPPQKKDASTQTMRYRGQRLHERTRLRLKKELQEKKIKKKEMKIIASEENIRDCRNI